MMTDMPGVETRVAVVPRFVPGVAQMGVIEMQTPRLPVVIGRLMQVSRAGHDTERQVEGTTTQGEDPTHPKESNRIQGIRAIEPLDGW